MDWSAPDPFNRGTFTGSWLFQSGTFSGVFCDVRPCGTFASDGSSGALAIPGNPVIPADPVHAAHPGDPVVPNDWLMWQFGGVITYTSNIHHDTCAYAPNASPGDPCHPATPSLIRLGQLTMADFTPFSASGPIFAFSNPIQVGTWTIDVRPVLESATLALLGVGLAAIGFAQRRERHVTA